MFTFIESVARYFSSPYKYSEKEEFERIFMKLEAIESEYNAENHRDIQTSYMPDTDESEWLERQGFYRLRFLIRFSTSIFMFY